MRPFFRFFAERHLLANLLTLIVILLGVNTAVEIRRDLWPDVDFGEMVVTTRYPGASPEDVELNVTNKIETELDGLSGIDRMVSFSMENISVIDVVIDPDAGDQKAVKTEIREAVGRVTDFPPEVTESPTITELKTSEFPVIEVGITGDRPYGELREIARLFEKKLEAIPGVARIDKFGYRAREITVDVDPAAVRQYQVPLRAIIAAIRQRNIRATAGSFESYTSDRNLVTLAQFHDPLEVGDVIVRSTFAGPAVRVRDLAVVRDGFEDARVLSRMNGLPAISFLISKKESADVIRTVDAVKRLVEQEQGGLPEGVGISYSNDYSRYVRNRFDVVLSNGLLGLALVVVLLSLFLSLRSAFWVALGIPVALLGVIFLLPSFGAYLDSVTLAAMIIVIGIIVDDGIIIAENVQRRREQGAAPLDAAVEGLAEVFGPVVTTVLTTFLAFAPLFLMTGTLGKFIFVIPLVITLALSISLLEATVALPAHLTAGRQRAPRPVAGRVGRGWFERLHGPFEGVLREVLRWRYAFTVFSVLLLGGTLWFAATHMKFTLFPASMADQFHILVTLPTGTSLRATADRMQQIEGAVTALPPEELESFVTRIGSHGALQGFQAGENENWAITTVNLAPFAERRRNADEIVEALRNQTNTLPGYDAIVYYIESGGPPVGKPITLRVVGADDGTRRRLADSVVALLHMLPGVKDIDRDDKLGKDQVEIRIAYDRLSRLGLTVADVSQNLRIAYDGEVVTSVRYGDEDVDFRVQLDAEARRDPRLLPNLLIPNRDGRLIPLSQTARFTSGPGPSSYYHFDGERAVTITADITKGTTTPVLATRAVTDRFHLDRDWPGMRLVVGGEAEETQASMASLMRAFALAIVGIYFLLVLLFGSLGQPLIVMLAVPWGIVGVIWAFALHGEALGFVGMLGTIGLAGVVVNDSLVLVSHVNDLRRRQPQDSVLSLVARGTAHRLRAVLLTTLTTVAGLLPLAYGLGGTDPYMQPMALALAYGLLFATPITLLLVPCVYLIGEDIVRSFRKLAPRNRATPA